VIHELLHNTVYLAGQTTFNESFAEFVGSRGAIMMFCEGEGEGSADCRLARGIWHDELVFGSYLSALVEELEALYRRQDLSTAEKIRLREEIFTRGQRSFTDTVRPQLQVSSYSSFAREPLNNALLIARRLYYHRLDLFDQLYARTGGDLPRTIRLVLDATRAGGGDPYGAVEELVRTPP